MKKLMLSLFMLLVLSGNSFAAILVFSPNGTYTTKTTLAIAATAADASGKTVVVTSPQVITTAIVWPADRELQFKKGGYVTFTGGGSLTGLKSAKPQDFGAIGDGINGDTVAIQKAIDSGAWSIRIPQGQYKITATIYIISKSRLDIVFDNSGIANANLLWYGPASTSGSKYPVIQFYGPQATGQNLNYSIHMSGLSIDGYAAGTNRAAIGISFGDLGSGYSELSKNIRTEDITVKNCRVGALIGGDASQFSDVANHIHTNWKLTDNLDYGIIGASVDDAGITFIDLDNSGNGYAPTNDSTDTNPLNPYGAGANVVLYSGEMTFLSGQSNNQDNAAFAPTTADFYQPGRIGFDGTSLKIFGWWSDVYGKFLLQQNGNHTVAMKGVRHWDGNMTDVNTPTSIEHTGQMFLDGCFFFGDIVSDPGFNGSISSIGTQFMHVPATLATQRPTLGVGTFKGYLVNTSNTRDPSAFFSQFSAQSAILNHGPEISSTSAWIQSGGYSTFTGTTGTSIASAINTSGTASYAVSDNFMNTNMLAGHNYTISINVTLNSGQAPSIDLLNSSLVSQWGSHQLISGVNAFFYTANGNESILKVSNSAVGNWSATFAIAEIPATINGNVMVTGNAMISGVPSSYANNAAAVAAGLSVGMFYRNGDVLQIVH